MDSYFIRPPKTSATPHDMAAPIAGIPRQRWEPMLDWIPYKDLNLMGVESIAVDPSDPARSTWPAAPTRPLNSDGASCGRRIKATPSRQQRAHQVRAMSRSWQWRAHGRDSNDGRILFLGTRHMPVEEHGRRCDLEQGRQLPCRCPELSAEEAKLPAWSGGAAVASSLLSSIRPAVQRASQPDALRGVSVMASRHLPQRRRRGIWKPVPDSRLSTAQPRVLAPTGISHHLRH